MSNVMRPPNAARHERRRLRWTPKQRLRRPMRPPLPLPPSIMRGQLGWRRSNQALDAAQSHARGRPTGRSPRCAGDAPRCHRDLTRVRRRGRTGPLRCARRSRGGNRLPPGPRRLEALERGDLAGAVLAVGSRHAAPAVPTKGRPIRSLVRGLRPGIDELLDSLIGGVALVDDWHTGIDASIAEPASTFVTAAGERFSSTGWRRGGTGSLVTAATLAEASEHAAAAEQEWLAATGVAESTRTAAQAARNALSAAQSEFAAATGGNAAAASALATASTTVERAANDLEGARETVDELGRRSEREASSARRARECPSRPRGGRRAGGERSTTRHGRDDVSSPSAPLPSPKTGP